MTTEELLQQITNRGLLTTEQLTRVRAQVAKSPSPVSAKALAKHLVDNGMLTLPQAQSLLSAPAQAAKPKPVEEDLGLAELEPLEELTPLAMAQPAAKKLAPRPAAPAAKKPAATKPASTPAAEANASLLEELVEMTPTSPGGNSLDLLAANPGLAADGNPLLAPASRKKKLSGLLGSSEPKKIKKGDNEWESPLIFFGGGALLLLLILGGIVFLLYLRGSGDKQFIAAEEDYKAGSYTQAIAKYTYYIDKNPKHPSVSLAKVHRGVARLKQSVQSADYSGALKDAHDVINEIENEKEFPEGRVEFRSILPDIAEGLAKDAEKQSDPAVVKAKLSDAEDALKLAAKVIPQSQRPAQRISSIQGTMAMATRKLDREAELAKTVDAMKAAVGKKDIAAAYEARKHLIKEYPDLQANETLMAAVSAVTDGERGAIQISTDARPAETKDPASPIVAQVALAARKAKDVSGSGPPVALLVQGAVLGFDSANGKLLWRRYVGLDSPTPPLRVDSSDTADVLAIDVARNQLVRLTATDGKLVWRQPIGDRIAGATVVDKQAVVSGRSGNLIAVDLKSGDVLRTATLPQGVRLAAAASSSLGRFYLLGEQSSIYVIGNDLTCQQAFYLGHEIGTVNVPPLVLPKHLIVIENRGASSCTLHALALGDDGKIIKVVQTLDLKGHVLTSPIIADRKLVLMTDIGHIKVMGVNASNVDQPLADLADQQPPSGDAHAVRFLLFDNGNLWIGDNHLVRYKVQSAAGRLMPSPLEDDYDNAAFQQPLLAVGGTLVHVRRPAGSPTVLVTGTRLEDGRRIWETQVGTPPAGEPLAGRGAAVVTASGQLFSLDAGALKQPAFDQPVTNEFEADGPIVLAARAELKDGSVVFAPAADDVRMFFVAAAKDGWAGRLIKSPEAIACPLASFGKGVLVPTKIGQVFWLNPANGKPVAAPFQPQVSAGVDFEWRMPEATADGKEFVIADGRRVYRVTLAREPAPHLEVVATSETLADAIITPAAVVERVVVVGDDKGQLRVFKLADMTTEKPVDLGGSVIWGPRRIGKHIFLTTANEELVCLDGEGKIVWRQSLEHGSLAGMPAVAGNELMISTLSGHVARLALADGKTLGIADLGQPLATGPVAFEKQWLVVATDGTLLVIEPPSGEAPQ